MSVTYPLAQADFWQLLPISSLVLDCAPQIESSGLGSGQQISREVAPALWRGKVTLGRLTPAEAAETAALMDMVRRTGASFLASDLTRPFPAGDPDGEILGLAPVTIQTIGADRRTLRLTGLPPHYLFARGDMIGVTWGASPLRYGLHRIVVAASADASGLTGAIEVAPDLPAALTTGLAVSLRRPAFKAVIAAGSVQAGTLRNRIYDGAGFDLIQTMR